MPGRKSGGRRAADAAAPADDGLEAPAVDPSPMFDEDPGESANVEEDLEEDEEEEEPAAAQLEYGVSSVRSHRLLSCELGLSTAVCTNRS